MISKRFNKKFYKLYWLILTILIVFNINYTIQANGLTESVYLGGQACGFTINTKGVAVLGLTEVVTENGVLAPSKDLIIEHDIILNIDGKDTNSFEDLENILEVCDGKPLNFTIKRDGQIIMKQLTPCKDLTGKYKLGLLLRDRLNGIGTLTFITKNGEFMGLGHPICDEKDITLDITGGSLFACSIFAVDKGEKGKVGELKGMFLSDKSIGIITQNLTVGIKGQINENFDISGFKEIEVAGGHLGSASIITTVNGVSNEEFAISIVKVDNKDKNNRNYVIKVNDSKLLEISGGIVQGMSGSPIVQDGKIIGAVTHVFLNDPTRGFGISIENMLAN